MSPFPRRVALAILGLALLSSAGTCPVQVGDESGGTGAVPGGLDLGGQAGTSWLVTTGAAARVSLRAGSESESVETPIARQTVELLDRSIALGDFCWRSDVVCPHQLLPNELIIAQGAATQLLLSHSGKGPLAGSVSRPLVGQLNGSELTVTLSITSEAAPAEPCTALAGSALNARFTSQAELEHDEAQGTTSEEPPAEERAEEPDSAPVPGRPLVLEGRITIVYAGSCLTLGGSGILEPTDRVEISVPFRADRRS